MFKDAPSLHFIARKFTALLLLAHYPCLRGQSFPFNQSYVCVSKYLLYEWQLGFRISYELIVAGRWVGLVDGYRHLLLFGRLGRL